MPELPTGTITFLFSDIEGSTRLLHEVGDRYAVVLADYRHLLRTALAAQRAIIAHPWPPRAQVRVRMGLHTGEPTLALGGYVGLDVHRAARICATGHGGQILLSQTTGVFTGPSVPEGASLREPG